MTKKGLALVLLTCMLLALSGCNDVMDLTEEETTLIAEYAADVLLKHDWNYTDRIAEGDRALERMESRTEFQPVDGVVETTEEPTETTEASTTEEVNRGRDLSGGIDEQSQSIEQDSDVTVQENNIAKIAGIENVDITYKDHLFSEQYPNTDEEGQVVSLEASEGYQLLVVRFGVACTTDSVTDVSMIEKNLEYRLLCNGNKAANPMLTILTDDLGTLETTVHPGEEQEAVLVFQISDDMVGQVESLVLQVSYNGVDYTMDIL